MTVGPRTDAMTAAYEGPVFTQYAGHTLPSGQTWVRPGRDAARQLTTCIEAVGVLSEMHVGPNSLRTNSKDQVCEAEQVGYTDTGVHFEPFSIHNGLRAKFDSIGTAMEAPVCASQPFGFSEHSGNPTRTIPAGATESFEHVTHDDWGIGAKMAKATEYRGYVTAAESVASIRMSKTPRYVAWGPGYSLSIGVDSVHGYVGQARQVHADVSLMEQ